MLDIDHFKAVNDTFGHPFGDFVLKKLADLCCKNFREIDRVYRYGGEEFFILLPETSKEEAIGPSQRLLETVRQQVFNYDGQQAQITISLGGVNFTDHASEKIDLIRLADQALYQAKETGRDKMVFHS